jgi:phospholipid/cholesterol/gamma-HCH transport system substrate-binding protein
MTKEFRLGGFILVALICFGTAVFLIGNREAMFHESYRLDTQFDNVAGLEEGAPVRVGGIREGIVKHIKLPSKPGEKVTVQMSLERATHDVVKQDSVAAIKSEGLLGDKYVEIGFGTSDAENVRNGDTIASNPPVDISNLIAKTDGILDTAGAAVENVKNLSGNLDSITAKVNSGRGTAGALVNDKTVYQQAANATAALSDDAEALKHNFLLRGFFKNRGYEDQGDLTRYEVARMPSAEPEKSFDYDSKKIFDEADKAKLKNGKTLNEAGRYLQQGNFGLAVIAASTGMTGDSQKDVVLTEAQALVVRDYLVKNFKFDDRRLKTIGLGKTGEDEINHIDISIYPPGTTAPAVATASRDQHPAKP